SGNTVEDGAVGATLFGGSNPQANRVTDHYSTVGGGVTNVAGDADGMDPFSADYATVGGGAINAASGSASTVGGGFGNTASGLTSTVSGGWSNTASGESATVGGGETNLASGYRATVAGGFLNTASGPNSFAAGRRAKANHPGAFVWADTTNADLNSTADNQFLIRAAGGVGIGKNAPETALDVAGTVTATAFAGDGSALTSVDADMVDGKHAADFASTQQLSFALGNMLAFALDGADTTHQEGMAKDLFSSDTAQFLLFMEYDAANDRYTCMDTSAAYWLIIEAASTTDAGDADAMVVQMDTGKWLVYQDSDTYEVNKAKVMKHLFYDGSASIIATGWTGVTAVKTCDAADVGEQAIWMEAAVVNAEGGGGGETGQCNIVGTFADTTGNMDCNSWSYVTSSFDSNGNATWEVPLWNALNTATPGVTSDEFGTDTSGETASNPADCRAHSEIFSAPNWDSSMAQALVLCTGGMTYDMSGSGGTEGAIAFPMVWESFGFGIPLLTAATESDLSCVMVTSPTTIPAGKTKVIVNVSKALAGGDMLSMDVSFDGGNNWTPVPEDTISTVSVPGTSMVLRFTISRVSNANTDYIDGWAAYYY
ncbi:MAG: hypothetical protein ACYS9X_04175, partial [Planctomycetota bacterium]